MKLSLNRTSESKGLIYQISSNGKIILSVERKICRSNVWMLYFVDQDQTIQAVMRQDHLETDFKKWVECCLDG
jgi:hypothetical protein